MTLNGTAPDAYAPECVETRTTTVTIGRPLVDAVKIETSIAVWNHASGRTSQVNLRIADDVIELNAHRAEDAADRLQRIVDDLRAKAATADRLAALEADTTAPLDGRARTVAV